MQNVSTPPTITSPVVFFQFLFFHVDGVINQPIVTNQSVVTDHYEMGDLLGEGGYGTVHMATRRHQPDDNASDSKGKPASAAVTVVKEAAAAAAAVLGIGGGKEEGRGGGGDAAQQRGEGASGGCVAIKKVGCSNWEDFSWNVKCWVCWVQAKGSRGGVGRARASTL